MKSILIPILAKLNEQMQMEFDYEINTIKLVENEDFNIEIHYSDNKSKNEKILNPLTFWDQLNLDCLENQDDQLRRRLFRANCLKRIVSKKKRRFQNNLFDLDLTYVTKRVIAMGYPSSGFQSLYRNSLTDIKRFFNLYHNDNVKVYNLCIEKNRIYNKSCFGTSSVGLFPAADHNPCPIKLILEFCVDIVLYFVKNPHAVAAVHCKAGKGRTGLMICCYLFFSGLCKNSNEALEHYAKTRTINSKGITIASQIRYIKYFETFLETNFTQPYINLTPKIIKNYLNMNTKNILVNFMNDREYFYYPNKFELKSIKIGPLSGNIDLCIKIRDFIIQDINYRHMYKKFSMRDVDGKIMFDLNIILNEKIAINSDTKIWVKGSGLNFYVWVNLWYSTLNLIKKFYIDQIMFGKSHYKLDYGIDLSRVISAMNTDLIRDGKPEFDKNNLNIFLKTKELDKFSKSNKINQDFGINICYALID